MSIVPLVIICLLLGCGLTDTSSATTTDFHKQALDIALPLLPVTPVWRVNRVRLYRIFLWLYRA